jgi:hypothetical protein
MAFNKKLDFVNIAIPDGMQSLLDAEAAAAKLHSECKAASRAAILERITCPPNVTLVHSYRYGRLGVAQVDKGEVKSKKTKVPPMTLEQFQRLQETGGHAS